MLLEIFAGQFESLFGWLQIWDFCVLVFLVDWNLML